MADFRRVWSSDTDFTVSSLNSLAANNIWRSDQVEDASPSDTIAEISYKLVCDANCDEDDQIVIRIARGNDASTEIRDAGIASTQGAITDTNEKAAVRDALNPVKVIRINAASQTISGIFQIYEPGTDWQVLIELVSTSGALSTGNVVSRRTGYMQSS